MYQDLLQSDLHVSVQYRSVIEIAKRYQSFAEQSPVQTVFDGSHALVAGMIFSFSIRTATPPTDYQE